MAASSSASPAARAVPAPSGQLARPLAVAAIAGQLVFVAAWLVAGALEPGYSHAEHGVSSLGARDAANPWLVNGAFVVLGCAVAALVPGLRAVLPRRPAGVVAAAGFAATGACLVVIGLLPLECGAATGEACDRAFRAGELDVQTYVHAWAAFASLVTLLLTPFAVARALWARPAAALALGCGIAGVVLAVLATAFWSSGGAETEVGGLVQRYELLNLHLWVGIVAAGVLHGTRPAPAEPAGTPLPPRDFFGRAWEGDGECVLWPAVLWRRFPLRFRASRTATWLTEDTWTFDDVATFSGGWRQERRRYCRFVTPQHIRVTAGDLPDGAEVRLDDSGYRILPFTVLIPAGPLRIPLRCHESGRLEGRTLVESFDLRFLGLPAGRATLRVRPVEDAAP